MQRSDSRTIELWALLQIVSVPTLVVADKYVVNMDVGRKRSLEIVDLLIAKELAGDDEMLGYGRDRLQKTVETIGLVFKMATDKYVGKLAFVRIYSGQLKKG